MKLFVEDGSAFYAPNEKGMTRKTTPEGFLLCEGVPIARTGEQIYAASELPLKAGDDGMIVVTRPEDEVFDDATIASFNGKPVTVEHPNEFVNPNTWKQLAVGTVQNTRRGEGADAEFLVADLLITDKAAIDYVNRELPELSCGYDSEYEQTEAGRATQHSIIGNHVALVDRGRAGPRVAIRDHFSKEVIAMSQKIKFKDRLAALLGAVAAKDHKTVDGMMEEEVSAPNDIDGYGGSEDAMNKKIGDAVDRAVRDAFKRMKDEEKEGKAKFGKELGAEGNGEEEVEAEDTVVEAEELKRNPDMLGRTWVGDSAAPLMKNVLQHAEILSPGISVPTSDAVGHRSVKQFMLTALHKALTTDAGKAVVVPLLRGRTLDSLNGREVHTLFSAAAIARGLANAAAARPAGIDPAKVQNRDAKSFGPAVTPAQIQELNDKFYGKKSA